MDFALNADQERMRARTREAALRLVAPHTRQADEAGVFRRDVIDALAREGFLGLPLPRRYGGEGIVNVSMTLVYEEMGRVDSSVRGFLAVHVGLVSHCLLDWGN